MKTKIFFIGAVLLLPQAANAASCFTTSCTNSTITQWTTYTVNDPNCETFSTTPSCVTASGSNQGVKIYSCQKCETGYDIEYTSDAITIPLCGSWSANKCVKCNGCSNCTSSDWTTVKTGYQSHTNKTCNCNTCNSSISYRCANGYYGTPTSTESGCERCPQAGSRTLPNGMTVIVYGTSTAGQNYTSTLCYISTTSSFTDTSGAYQYTQQCNYSTKN